MVGGGLVRHDGSVLLCWTQNEIASEQLSLIRMLGKGVLNLLHKNIQ